MDIAIMGVALAFSILILKWKFEHKRYADFTMDLSMLIALSYFMGGTVEGELVAIIAQTIISFYLLAFPPKFMLDMRNSMDV
jgi:hypothetical protein